MSFLTDAEKTAINSVFDELHDTFKRSITVYRIGKSALVATDASFNGMYEKTLGKQGGAKPTYTKTTIYARIKYFSKAELAGPDLQGQTGVYIPSGTVRLKVTAADYESLKGAEKIEIDGQLYKLLAMPVAVGPFGVNHYAIYLTRSDT